jgi:CubicO group peptidase (beta-lactamase class C family)
MSDTFFVLTDDKNTRLAEGIENSNGNDLNINLPMRELVGRGYRVPNGGIFSTPNDLAKFVEAMMGKPSLISNGSLKEMQQIPKGGRNYGLGLMLTKNKQIDVFGHNGSVAGYTARYAIEKKVVMQ